MSWGSDDKWSKGAVGSTESLPTPLISAIPHLAREKVFACRYWKERCFGINAESLVERVSEDVDSVGILYGGFNRPTPLFCLLVKLFQIKPDKDTLEAYISLSDGAPNDQIDSSQDLRYLRVLAAIFVRLTLPTSALCYNWIEGLLADGRKVAIVQPDGTTGILAIDQIAEHLLWDPSPFLGLNLPPLVKRTLLESKGSIQPYKTWLPDDIIQSRSKRNPEKEKQHEEVSLAQSIDETNALRASLGLKPLR